MHKGFFDYTALDACSLLMPLELAPPRLAGRFVAESGEVAVQLGESRRHTLRRVLQNWADRFGVRPQTPSCVRLCPTLASRIVRQMWACVHAVLVSRRLEQKRFLIAGYPSKKAALRLTRGVEEAPVDVDVVETEPRQRRRRYCSTLTEVWLVLGWLEAP